MYGKIVISLPAECGVVAATCTKIAPKNQTTRPHRHAAIASWWTARNPISPTTEAAATPGKRSADERRKEHRRTQREGCSPPTIPRQRVLRGGSAKQRGATAATSSEPGSCGRSSRSRKTECPGSCSATGNRSVSWAAIVNSQLLDNMLRVVTVVQQIMTEFNGAVSEEAK
jgi:hypothetical protein